MHKNLAVKDELHTQIKVAAANYKLTINDYLSEMIESRHQLAGLAHQIYGLQKGSVITIETDTNILTLKCEEVLPFDRKD